jgi:hypothetical protein
VIFQYTGVGTDALRVWEELDPCSPIIPEVLLPELAAGAERIRTIGEAEGAAGK